MQHSGYIQVRDENVPLYRDVDLFYKVGKDNYQLYKPAGSTLSELRLDGKKFPNLFINKKDKKKATIELHKTFNHQLETEIRNGDIGKVKNVLVNLVEDTLEDPSKGTFATMPETMDMVIGNYVNEPQNLQAIASLSFKDYTTAIHSINVMALTVVYCFSEKYSMEDTRSMGLGALYHDLGKTKIPSEILTTSRKLSDEEFQIMQKHPALGLEIIEDSNLDNECIHNAIMEHHEKLDGSGYPNHLTDVSPPGQIVGIIDAYEALTNDSRPYRHAAKPLDALKMIKKEVDQGTLNSDIFEKFAYSLVQ